LLTDTTGMYPPDMPRIALDARHARPGGLKGGGVREICAPHGRLSDRLVALASTPRKAIGGPKEAT
jgi:hypothetical protein